MVMNLVGFGADILVRTAEMQSVGLGNLAKKEGTALVQTVEKAGAKIPTVLSTDVFQTANTTLLAYCRAGSASRSNCDYSSPLPIRQSVPSIPKIIPPIPKPQSTVTFPPILYTCDNRALGKTYVSVGSQQAIDTLRDQCKFAYPYTPPAPQRSIQLSPSTPRDRQQRGTFY